MRSTIEKYSQLLKVSWGAKTRTPNETKIKSTPLPNGVFYAFGTKKKIDHKNNYGQYLCAPAGSLVLLENLSHDPLWKNLHLLGAIVADSLEHVLYRGYQTVEKIFITGGAQVYQAVIGVTDIDGVYLTIIQKNWRCNLFFPEIPKEFTKQIHIKDIEENGNKLEFWYYGK